MVPLTTHCCIVKFLNKRWLLSHCDCLSEIKSSIISHLRDVRFTHYLDISLPILIFWFPLILNDIFQNNFIVFNLIISFITYTDLRHQISNQKNFTSGHNSRLGRCVYEMKNKNKKKFKKEKILFKLKNERRCLIRWKDFFNFNHRIIK